MGVDLKTMVKIYEDYGDEPDPVFLPLPEPLACQLYDLEMESFADDIPFYQHFLPLQGKVLEIGCGSGRVARRLATARRKVVGIDISPTMTARAASHRHPHCRFCVMDMLALAFDSTFTAALLPYNTLNLLTASEDIRTCLQGIHTLLDPGGQLLLQLFIPNANDPGDKKTQFQFQIFEPPEGGRVIKEIRTTWQSDSGTLVLDERFRLRPTGPGATNSDYRLIRTISALPLDGWLELFGGSGFALVACWANYSPNSCDQVASPLRMLVLQKKA